jgi:hypothetical protein
MKIAPQLEAILNGMTSIDGITKEIDGRIYSVKTFNPTSEFWNSYHGDKESFKAAGINTKKDAHGVWVVEHRRLLSESPSESRVSEVIPNHSFVTPNNDIDLEKVESPLLLTEIRIHAAIRVFQISSTLFSNSC